MQRARVPLLPVSAWASFSLGPGAQLAGPGGRRLACGRLCAVTLRYHPPLRGQRSRGASSSSEVEIRRVVAPGSEEEMLQPSDGPGSRRGPNAGAGSGGPGAGQEGRRAGGGRARPPAARLTRCSRWPTAISRRAAASSPARSRSGSSSGCCRWRSSRWPGSESPRAPTPSLPESAARSAGLGGLVSSSVAHASEGKSWWYALLSRHSRYMVIATRSVLRVLIGAHRLIWADVRAAAPRPKLGATVGCLCSSGVASTPSAESVRTRERRTAASACSGPWSCPFRTRAYGCSSRFACRTAPPAGGMPPGAIVFGLGIEAVDILAAYLIGPYALEKQGTYGALGIAAAILLGLFVVSRLVVFTAVINVTLWERRQLGAPTRRRARVEPGLRRRATGAFRAGAPELQSRRGTDSHRAAPWQARRTDRPERGRPRRCRGRRCRRSRSRDAGDRRAGGSGTSDPRSDSRSPDAGPGPIGRSLAAEASATPPAARPTAPTHTVA